MTIEEFFFYNHSTQVQARDQNSKTINKQHFIKLKQFVIPPEENKRQDGGENAKKLDDNLLETQRQIHMGIIP